VQHDVRAGGGEFFRHRESKTGSCTRDQSGAAVQKRLCGARHDRFRQPRISTPAHSSRTFAMKVKSESAPNLALVIASIWRTEAPQTIGTPIASASSMQRRTSL